MIGLKAYTEVSLIKVKRKWVSETYALESSLMFRACDKVLYFPLSPLPKTCGDRTMCQAWFLYLYIIQWNVTLPVCCV